jgi:cytochrome P450
VEGPDVSVSDLRRDPLGTLARLGAQGDAVPFRVGREQVLLGVHPDVVREVLLTQNKRFAKVNVLNERGRPPASRAHLADPDWRGHVIGRRLVQPAFGSARQTAHADVVREEANAVADRLSARDGDVVDVAAEMTTLALAVSSRALFGGAPADGYGPVAADVAGVMAPFTLAAAPGRDRLSPSRVSALARAGEARRRLLARMTALIEARRRVPADDVPGLLAADEEGDPAVDALLVFVAGADTTASALAWTWHLLASDEAARDGVRDEAAARAVFAETLRLYPPSWTIGRRALEPGPPVAGHEVATGQVVLLSPWVTHRDPRFFPHPGRFDPVRFADDARPAAWFPFGIGPRQCLGERLAWLEGTVAVSEIARRIVLHRVEGGAAVEIEPGATLRPRGGLPMRVEVTA